MASVVNRANGRREIQFTDSSSRRQTIRLGKIPKRTAEAIKTRVEYLVNAQVTKHPIDGDTAKWVASLDDVLAGKLARVGLIRIRESALLGSFVADYLATRGETIKPGTMQVWRLTQRNLAGFFGEHKPLRDITAGDAEDFRNHLLTSGLEESTTRKRCATASIAHPKKSDTQQRKYNPRRSSGRLAMDCNFRRVRCLSSSLVFA